MPEAEPWEYSLYIPNDPRAVPICRRTLRLILTMHGLIRLADAAELLVAELVGNAVRHTKGPAALRLRCAGGVLRLGAWDTDNEELLLPEPRRRGPARRGPRRGPRGRPDRGPGRDDPADSGVAGHPRARRCP
ncbi:ATP-binding protein [Streptomyces sp. NPDC051684]|uniref:ATP-binding protein n=1 Tax=Streptomyces sp. NPDC051684 TaxID=3365670 RepID=UPI0037963883